MKVVVEEDYLIADSLVSPRYVNEMGGLRRIQSNKVCVYCDKSKFQRHRDLRFCTENNFVSCFATSVVNTCIMSKSELRS